MFWIFAELVDIGIHVQAFFVLCWQHDSWTHIWNRFNSTFSIAYTSLNFSIFGSSCRWTPLYSIIFGSTWPFDIIYSFWLFISWLPFYLSRVLIFFCHIFKDLLLSHIIRNWWINSQHIRYKSNRWHQHLAPLAAFHFWAVCFLFLLLLHLLLVIRCANSRIRPTMTVAERFRWCVLLLLKDQLLFFNLIL